jgi:hypothetical protein
MLDAAQARAEALGAQRAAERRDAVAALVSTALPRATVTIEEDDVVIAGRAIADDPAMRWIAGELR